MPRSCPIEGLLLLAPVDPGAVAGHLAPVGIEGEPPFLSPLGFVLHRVVFHNACTMVSPARVNTLGVQTDTQARQTDKMCPCLAAPLYASAPRRGQSPQPGLSPSAVEVGTALLLPRAHKPGI